MNLQSGEEILHESRPPIFTVVVFIILGIATLMFFVGIIFLIAAYAYHKKRFYVTNKRVIIEGITGTVELPLSKIESVSTSAMKVTLTGSGGKQTIITGIKDLKEFAESISKQLT